MCIARLLGNNNRILSPRKLKFIYEYDRKEAADFGDRDGYACTRRVGKDASMAKALQNKPVERSRTFLKKPVRKPVS
jgi:hypothetical protein